MYRVLSSAFLLFGLMHCSSQEKNYRAAAWPEADQLFRQDANWVGADDAYSVRLSEDKTLWLFADSFIDTTYTHNRHAAKLIRNSIAMQTGTNPASAAITFFWNKNNLTRPASFFPEQGGDWFWPGHGIRLQNQLIIFLMRVRSTTTGLGFEVYKWDAVLIPNPDDSPTEWAIQWLNVPDNPYQVIVGSASILQIDDYVYAFSAREGTPDHTIFLTRWPVKDFARGDLSVIEWWESSRYIWVRQTALKAIPTPVFTNGQTEFTVHFDPRQQRYLCIQTLGFGAANVYYRLAKKIIGTWSEPVQLYEPPEKNYPGILIYAAKAHPQLTGADMVLTYATNSTKSSDLLTNSLVYYPRFIKVRL